MALTAECEGCSVSAHLTPEDIEEIIEETFKGKNIESVSEEEYNRRVAACKACDNLIYGTTCRQSGNIIQVNAKIAKARCPYPYQSKW